MGAIYARDAITVEDSEEDLWAALDYAWLLRCKILTHTDAASRSFRAGYRVGGEIGRRRYARRNAQSVPQ